MSEWVSDKQPGWGDEPAQPEEKGQGASSGKQGWLGNKPSAMPPESGRDWRLFVQLVMSLQAEQRRRRGWGIFFKFLTFGYLFVLLFLIRSAIGDGMAGATGAHTALVEANGTIAGGELARADNLVGAPRSAFEAECSRAAVLRIN